MNGSGEEKRLCRKCGKRLPSNNNFCMFCGCNNNLTVEEEEKLKSTPTNNSIGLLSNKKNKIDEPKEKAPKNKQTIIRNLIYVFILLDIIAISLLLSFKSEGMYYEKFQYNLDNYDKVFYLNNDSFLVLDNNKLKTIGISTLDEKTINEINNEGIIDIEQTSDNVILIETKNKLYFNSAYSSSFQSKELENPSKNAFKDYNLVINYYTNINEDYYNDISDDYFIKKNELYKNEQIKESYYTYKKDPYFKFKSTKVLNKKQLKLTNPEIIYHKKYDDYLIIKGDGVLKEYSKGKITNTVTKIDANNRTYNLKDFKYVFNKGKSFFLICKNGEIVNYVFADKDSANYEDYTDYSTYATLGSTGKTENKELLDFKTKAIILTIVAVVVLIGSMYKLKESSFIISVLVSAAILFVYILLLYIMLLPSEGASTWNFIKELIKAFPGLCIIGLIIAQIKEISNYIIEKLKIDTTYHFLLLFIAICATLVALTVLTSNILAIIPLPGIIWVFLTQNNEKEEEIDVDIYMLAKLFGLLAISFIICFILCNIFNMTNYYLYILAVAFSLSCFVILDEKDDIKNCLIKTAKAASVLIFTIVLFILSGIPEFFNINNDYAAYGEKFMKEYIKEHRESVIKIYFEYGSIILVFILLLCIVLGLLIYLAKKPEKNITKKFDNRLFKIFIYMIILTVVCSIVMLALPDIAKMIIQFIASLLKIQSSFGISDLFSSFNITRLL